MCLGSTPVLLFLQFWSMPDASTSGQAQKIPFDSHINSTHAPLTRLSGYFVDYRCLFCGCDPVERTKIMGTREALTNCTNHTKSRGNETPRKENASHSLETMLRENFCRFFFLWLIVVLEIRGDDDTTVLRWASSGGGWRAMVVNMGYANAFVKAGLLDDTTCQFSAISSNSGGTWFMLQFFFSQIFFDSVTTTDTSAFKDFILDWLGSYGDLLDNLPDSKLCSLVSLFGLFPNDLSTYCKIFVSSGDYTEFITEMLRRASENFGDAGLENRPANSENKLPAFATTDLLVQTSIAANSRFEQNQKKLLRKPLGVSYIGTSDPNQADQVLAVPLATQYSVEGEIFRYAVPDSSLPITTRTGSGPWKFKFNDWKHFFLYPTSNGEIFIPEPTKSSNTSVFRYPFSGNPTINTLAAASSANLDYLSGRAPSYFAQRSSVAKYDAKNTGNLLSKFVKEATNFAQTNLLFNLDIFAGFSVCSQWPNPCGAADGRFLDGGVTDGPTLALNIGKYHTAENGDLSKTMKVILTINNFYRDSNVKFLSYFSAPFNQGVRPGDFVWPPATVPDSISAQNAPWRSMQIFEDYLDDESMLSRFIPIPGTQLTTALYKTRTLENIAFGVKEGQDVEILLVQINSNIPTALFTRNALNQWINPLADLAATISNSEELIARIKSFVES